MPTNSDSPTSRRSRTRPQGDKLKFTPNLSQLREATALLPDPDQSDELRHTCRLSIDGKSRQVEFVKKRITRGDSRVNRWMYEGKVLIRKRDI